MGAGRELGEERGAESGGRGNGGWGERNGGHCFWMDRACGVWGVTGVHSKREEKEETTSYSCNRRGWVPLVLVT